MRRNDREITDSREILSIVNECKVIHLAMLCLLYTSDAADEL